MRSTLLKPFRCSLRHRFLPDNTVPLRTVVALVLAVIVTIALYKISFRVLSYFHSQNELGIILSLKIFQMAWITVFAMLIFSCMVSAVSTLFLSQDNEILFASPAPPADLYFMRYVTTSIYTSWMMVIFSIPVFAAYGEVFNAGWAYWPLLTATILATAAIASGFGMAVTVVLVNIFPARRTKDIVLYLSLCFGIFIYIMFRLMRPEDLVNPEKYGHFIEYLSSISTPAGPYVPGAWAANFLSGYLLDARSTGCSSPSCSSRRWHYISSAKWPWSSGSFPAFQSRRNHSAVTGGSGQAKNTVRTDLPGYSGRRPNSFCAIRPNGRRYS